MEDMDVPKSNLYIYYTHLSQPIKIITILYILCVILYNFYQSYNNAVLYLNKYRDDTLTENDKWHIESKYNKVSEWTCIKYGANYRIFDRLWNSIIFPITIVGDIVPYLVLQINKDNE